MRKSIVEKGAGKNKYLYNGKELNSDFGLDWSDYGARYYDAAIGRWNSVDPLAELYFKHNPYHYVLNNPTGNFDPNGMNSESFINDLWNNSGSGSTTWTNSGDGSFSDGNGNSLETGEASSTGSPCPNPPDCGGVDPTMTAGLLAGTWYGFRDGVSNLLTLPLLNTIVGEAALIRKVASNNGVDLSGISDEVITANLKVRFVVGEAQITTTLGFYSSMLERGLDLGGIVAPMYGGSGAFFAKTPGGGGSFKIIRDKFLKKNNIDAHQLKKDYLGDKAKIANYDLYKNTTTGKVFIFRKGGKGEGIETYINID